MDRETIKKRVHSLRIAMKKARLDGLIVTKTENVRYLTNFSGHDSWAVILGRSAVLITDSRYTEQARGECLGCRIVERRKRMVEALVDELSRREGLVRIGIENTVSLAVYEAVRKSLGGIVISTVPAGGLVESLRVIKDRGEAGQIRRAAGIAWQSLDAALRQVRAGITEQELAAVLDFEMRRRSATAGFDTIVAFGPNGSRNHHQPGPRRLRKQDTLLIDFGARVEGYTCDITRSFAFGAAGREYRRAWQAVNEARQAAIAQVADGVKIEQVDAAARAVIEKAGFPTYGHGTGHGLGLEVHEAPFVSGMDRKGRLRAGQVITIEPGIYLPGRFGIRIEDDVLVTGDGGTILTADRRFGFSEEQLRIL